MSAKLNSKLTELLLSMFPHPHETVTFEYKPQAYVGVYHAIYLLPLWFVYLWGLPGMMATGFVWLLVGGVVWSSSTGIEYRIKNGKVYRLYTQVTYEYLSNKHDIDHFLFQLKQLHERRLQEEKRNKLKNKREERLLEKTQNDTLRLMGKMMGEGEGSGALSLTERDESV